jgi:hypothetical protein
MNPVVSSVMNIEARDDKKRSYCSAAKRGVPVLKDATSYNIILPLTDSDIEDYRVIPVCEPQQTEQTELVV